MKSAINLLEQMRAMPYCSKTTVYQLGKQLRLTEATINTYISRFLKRKEIIQLKRGLYVATDSFEKNKSDISYHFYLANIIRTPSYISSWTALQYYNLTTEAIYPVTSVTSKVTKNYKTRAGSFVYQSINHRLFSEFSLAKGKFDFFIASPGKALFDLLYFRTRQFQDVPGERIQYLVEDLRIDIGEMDEAEQEKFYKMTKEYVL